MVVELWPLLGAPIVRSVAGWLENALEDGKIDKFEWSQLAGTVFRVGIIGIGLLVGFDLEPIAAAGTAVVADFAFKALRS